MSHTPTFYRTPKNDPSDPDLFSSGRSGAPKAEGLGAGAPGDSLAELQDLGAKISVRESHGGPCKHTDVYFDVLMCNQTV